jgi:class 3 adenylate cyclase
MVQRQAIRIYWIGSALAVGEAFLLFTLGLELRAEQVWTLVLFGFPAPLIMYFCDHWLIKRHVRPIEAVLRLLAGGYPIAPPVAYSAYLQALNLPVLTLLRVLLVHAPSVLIPATLLMLLANQVADLGLTWWQLCVIWSLWPITAAPHAIVEYFLIDRYMRRVLDRLEPLIGEALITPIPPASLGTTLRLLAGAPLDTPQLIRTATGTQLALLFIFVSLMPMCVLGGSVYLKVTAVSASASGVSFTALGPWIVCLILLSAGVTIAIVTLMSRRVHSAMTDLLEKMRQVLEGDLSGHWSPRTTDEFFDLGIGFNAMLLGLRERETIKDTFGRFVSHEVAEVVLDGRVPLNGEVREVTILFQDIRGFTSLSERTPPVVLLQLVNDFFTEMVAAVETHGGIVKQFLGDGVMALFGVPAVHADAPARAVRTALDMLARLAVFNTRRQAQGEAPLRIGIGIHTGEVIAGCIGPDTRLEYGVVGDAVNLASRVQDLTKQVGTAILVTDDTAARLGAGFVLGTRTVLPVRGKTQPIGVIEVLGALPMVPEAPVLISDP